MYRRVALPGSRRYTSPCALRLSVYPKSRRVTTLSVEAVSWVLDYAETESLADRMVLIVLAEHADKKGANAWPSVATIMRQADLSERQVWYSLKRLRASGAVSLTGKKPRGTAVYALSMVKPSTPARTAPARTAPAQVALSPLQPLHPTPARTAPEPSLTVHEPPLRAKRARDPIWDALILIEGEPVTKSERGRLNAAAKQLRDAGVDAAAIPAVAAAYRAEWPNITLTANALVANWGRFANGNGHQETGAEKLRRAMAERGVT